MDMVLAAIGQFLENADILAFVAAIVAIVVSWYSLIMQRRLGHETATQTMIHDQYGLCRELDVLRVEHPEVSHMFALPDQREDAPDPWENYWLFKRQVRMLLQGDQATDVERSRLYLQEHAAALHVCDIYEQTLGQRQLAQGARDGRRFATLDALVKYYEDRMLRNPRLRFHWDHGASDMMEQGTRDQYDERVRKPHPHDPIDETSPLDKNWSAPAKLRN